MESCENPMARSSGIKPPSKIPPMSPLRSGLCEMAPSDNNTRAMAAPSAVPSKHKPSGRTLLNSTSNIKPPIDSRHRKVPEPQPKRKTLAERAGEPIRPNGVSALAAPRPVNSFARNNAAVGSRSNFAASTSRLPSNTSSRTTSTNSTANSFASSVGPGSRQTNSTRLQMPRSTTSHGRHGSKSTYGNRPATSMERGSVAEDEDGHRKRESFDESKERETFQMFTTMAKTMEMTVKERGDMQQEIINILKNQLNELTTDRTRLTTRNEELEAKIRDIEDRKSRLERDCEEMDRKYSYEMEDLRRKHRNELQDLTDQHRRETEHLGKRTQDEADKLRREFQEQADTLVSLHKQEQEEQEKRLKTELEDEKSRRAKEVEELSSQLENQLKGVGVDLQNKDREIASLTIQLKDSQAEVERMKTENIDLKTKISEAATNTITLDSANRAMKAKIEFLESDSQAQSEAFNDLHRRMQEAIEAAEIAQEKLRVEETLRRKLHNQVQELKGNIRVFCRVRPNISNPESDAAQISFPDSDTDSKEVIIQGPEQRSAMGTVTSSANAFNFDRVFGPSSQNGDVFAEISQLIQSALDGYNVCIFCYGQTGSGKTHTMSSKDGMIPRATAQIYAEAQRLSEKGWKYDIQGSFVEVYNENLNDLLGSADELDKKKLEIKHDPVKKQTTIQSATLVPLDSPTRVEEILKRADTNRSVAATKANERSSRSHSVFILKLFGINEVTGERSEGTLNLVDLAGSERLSHSQATGDRLKETQSINRSLSCLGDVIAALGQAGKNGTGHIPYRNSKLTHLLQYSLGGNSKTLMFVMISPLTGHLSETLTSLKFATKVHNTHIGTAKRQAKVKD